MRISDCSSDVCSSDLFLLREAVPDPRLASVQRALSTFTRDWQAAWACHGEDRTGWPRYRALLQALHAELVALGINQIGLRNEAGLLHALTACLFEVALADGASGQDEAQTGTASGRAGVGQYVSVSVVAVCIKKK